ncbi:hypothetical protein [Tumidithrix helvetica]|uniref:hypothetical protein n=1 Tax=Tumidithrix helvetica TaxID=3457545 RepID=UPI003CC5F078
MAKSKDFLRFYAFLDRGEILKRKAIALCGYELPQNESLADYRSRKISGDRSTTLTGGKQFQL